MADIEKIAALTIDTGKSQTSVKELRNELKSLKDTLVSAQEGSDEYNAALKRAAEIQHTLKETTEQVRATAADWGQVLSNTTKTVGGMVAGLQAATATMKLMGVENEDVIKSLEKMQSLMALTQSFSGIEQGIKSFKALTTTIQGVTGATSAWGKALVSTGIGAIVVAIGYLIANLDEVSQWLDELTGETDTLGKVMSAVTGAISASWTALIGTFKAVGNAIVTYITVPVKSVMKAIKAFSETDGSVVDKLKAASKAAKNEFTSEWGGVVDDFKQMGKDTADAYHDAYNKAENKRLAGAEKKRQEELKKQQEEQIKAREAYRKAQNEKLNIQLEVLKRSTESEKEKLQEQIKIETERLKLFDKNTLAYEQQLTKLAELEQKLNAGADLNKELDIELAKLKATETDRKTILERSLDIEQRRLSLLQKGTEEYWNQISVINNITDKLKKSKTDGLVDLKLFDSANTQEDLDLAFASQMDSIQQAYDQGLISVEEFERLKTEIVKKYTDQRNQMIGDEVNNQKAKLKLGISIASNFADALGTIGSAMDENNEKQFEAAKAFNISAAIINTITGAINAYMGAVGNTGINAIPVVGPALAMAMGITNAAAISVAGAMQIAKISKTKFKDKNTAGIGNVSAAAGPSAGAVANLVAPVQYTQDIQGANIEESLQDTRVYVVESDITDTQERVQVTESEATF
jgi:hypothetical protein